MIFRLLAVVMMLCMLCTARAQQVQGPLEMTFAVVGYEIPKKDAAVILQGLTEVVDPAGLMQQAAKANAKLSRLVTVKAQSGVRVSTKEQAADLKLEAVLDADAHTSAVTLALSEVDTSLHTALMLAEGQTAFLGTLEEPDKDVVKLVFIRALPGTGAANAAPELVTRTFDAPHDLLTAGRPPGAAPLRAEAVLKAHGIDFPKGSSALFVASRSKLTQPPKLIVKNTPANLDRVKACLNKMMQQNFPQAAVTPKPPPPPPPPPEGLPITMVLQGYELSKKDPLVEQAPNPKTDAQELLARLAALAARGLAKMVALPGITGSSGHRSSTSSGDSSLGRVINKHLQILSLTPVLNADQGKLSITGLYVDGPLIKQDKVTIQTDIPFGGTAYVGMMNSEASKDNAVLLFLKVAAQPAAKAP